MTAASKQKDNWRQRLNLKTETSLMHIARAADQLQSLLPTQEGENWSWWRVLDEPKLVEVRAEERIEIDPRPRNEIPSLNRLGF